MTLVNQVFGKYYNWDGLRNYKWTLIRSYTKDLTVKKRCTLVLPLMNFYLNPVRAELITNYKLLDKVNKVDDLSLNSFTTAFIKRVTDIINLIDTLEGNGITVTNIELSNEMYMDDGNGVVNYLSKTNKIVWSRTNNTQLSLDVYKALCSMIVRLIKLRNKPYRFFFPVSEELDGGLKDWNSYFISNLDNMKVDGIVMHPYARGVCNSTDLNTIYNFVLAQRKGFYKYVTDVVIPRIGINKYILLSEFSNSENFPQLRGQPQDQLLYTQEIGMQKAIPQIIGSHYHALANGNQPGCAYKAAGWMKQSQVTTQLIGQAYQKL